MADFLTSHKRRLIIEGGYSDIKDDNGNWTGGIKGKGVLIGSNLGIAAATLKAYLGRTPTVEEMKGLTQKTAHDIYIKNYWLPIRGDDIEFQESANQVYDNVVNFGVSAGIKIQQRALGLKETGKMNQETLNKINNK